MVTPSGFEPKLTGPKPVVLPLHNGVTPDRDVIYCNVRNLQIKKIFFYNKSSGYLLQKMKKLSDEAGKYLLNTREIWFVSGTESCTFFQNCCFRKMKGNDRNFFLSADRSGMFQPGIGQKAKVFYEEHDFYSFYAGTDNSFCRM